MDEQKSPLRKAFQEKHVYEHSTGIVNRKYIAVVPEDASLLGSSALLSSAELENAASTLRAVLSTFVDAR